MKWVLEGVSGPGRKLSVCSMLKEEMETLEGAGRETHTTVEDKIKLTLKFKGMVRLLEFSIISWSLLFYNSASLPIAESTVCKKLQKHFLYVYNTYVQPKLILSYEQLQS